MITIAITAFKEPASIRKAIEAITSQDISEEYELICSCPDDETAAVVKEYSKYNPAIKHLKDPGCGKYTALNLIFSHAKGRIIIMTDGDVWLTPGSVKEMIAPFDDAKVGLATGRPVSANPRDNMWGYWSHLLTEAGAHPIRTDKVAKGEPFSISGYLWAVRKGVIDKLPLDVAEDAIAPYLALAKGWKIAYVPKAKVLVKYPTNWHDWYTQKVRSIRCSKNLRKYVDARYMRTFGAEASAAGRALHYSESFRELVWTFMLIAARTAAWAGAWLENAMKDYGEGWERIESTK
ncbi:MAG: glycosyltransferase [Candidatus Aenigmatarchaeota archaeon]